MEREKKLFLEPRQSEKVTLAGNTARLTIMGGKTASSALISREGRKRVMMMMMSFHFWQHPPLHPPIIAGWMDGG